MTEHDLLTDLRKENALDRESGDRDLLTVKEAAKRLHVSRTTLYKLLGEGTLPSLVIFSARRIPSAAVDAWINEQVQNSGGKLAS